MQGTALIVEWVEEQAMNSDWAMQGTPDAVRAYLRDLRIGRNIPHHALAREIGLSRRSLIGWEMGETKEMKQGPLLRAITVLQASQAHLQQLTHPSADVELGHKLAIEQLAISLPGDALERAKKAIRRQRPRRIS